MSDIVRSCPYCNRTFTTADGLTAHILQTHIPTDIGEFLSQLIQTRTATNDAVVTTTAAAAPEITSPDVTSRPSTSSGGATTCPICNLFCESSEIVRIHQNACRARAAAAVYTPAAAPQMTNINISNPAPMNINISAAAAAATTTPTRSTSAVPETSTTPIPAGTTREHICTVCQTSHESAETLLQHCRQFHPERVVCTVCGQNFQNSRSLNSHRSQNHPDRRRTYAGGGRRRNSSRPPVRSPDTYNDRSKRFERIWRKGLNMEIVCRADRLPHASPEDILYRNVCNFIDSRSINYEQTFHYMIPTTVTLEEVRHELSDAIEEIFPHQCICFCNLLIPLAEQQPHFDERVARRLFETVLLPSKDTRWHHHCIIVFKEDRYSMRTIQRRIAALLRRKQPPDDVNNECLNYRRKQIKTFDHLLNTILYIMGRRSKKKINTHMFHAMGFYITSEQREHIIKLYRPTIVPDMNVL